MLPVTLGPPLKPGEIADFEAFNTQAALANLASNAANKPLMCRAALEHTHAHSCTLTHPRTDAPVHRSAPQRPHASLWRQLVRGCARVQGRARAWGVQSHMNI